MTEATDLSRAGGRVAIVGGGLAGMAAALALAENGCQVDLFEQHRRLGGRAASFRDSKTGEFVDHSIHVGMGCCTNFLDFVGRTGVDTCFDRHRRLNFVGPDGEICRFDSWRWLPAPLHLFPGFSRLRYLSLGERLSIGRCLTRLGRLDSESCRGLTAGQWLHDQEQTARAIERFWSVVLVSALGESIDRVALSMARKVFLDGFMRSASGYELVLPRVPLGEIFDIRAGTHLRKLGVDIHLKTPVRSIEMGEIRAEALVTADARRCEFDALVVAVPWTSIGRVFSPDQQQRLHADRSAEQIGSSAITAIHLWFDREIMPLAHAAFVGRTSDWIFRHGAPSASASGHRYQVVISASNELARQPREELLQKVLGDLQATWPKARAARLVHSRIVTERHAVFSITPELAEERPNVDSAIDNVYLAGDWTNTGWPATMEGAILSGYKAAAAILRKMGRPGSLPLPGLQPSWLARWVFRGE